VDELKKRDLKKRVLGSFALWQKGSLDLHTLFEAGGNDPEERTAVFDTVELLVKEGLLEELGNDFFALTAAGKEVWQSTKNQDS
jgi:hypothetical protein